MDFTFNIYLITKTNDLMNNCIKSVKKTKITVFYVGYIRQKDPSLLHFVEL